MTAQVLPEVTVDPEAAFVGALLHLDRGPLLGFALLGCPEVALADPRHRAVFAAVRAVWDAGHRPDPAAVVAQLERAGTALPFDRNAGRLVLDLYGAVPVPASVLVYRRAVLERSARRRAAEVAERLQQAAETASMPDLLALLDGELAALRGALLVAGWPEHPSEPEEDGR